MGDPLIACALVCSSNGAQRKPKSESPASHSVALHTGYAYRCNKGISKPTRCLAHSFLQTSSDRLTAPMLVARNHVLALKVSG